MMALPKYTTYVYSLYNENTIVYNIDYGLAVFKNKVAFRFIFIIALLFGKNICYRKLISKGELKALYMSSKLR